MRIFNKPSFSAHDFIHVSNEIKNRVRGTIYLPHELTDSKEKSLKRLANNTWVQHTKDGWCLVRIRDGYKISTSSEVVTRDLAFNDVPKSIKAFLDPYPEDIQAIVINSLSFSKEANDTWELLERLNPKDPDELALVALMDYRFLAALLYNRTVGKYTVGVKNKIDGYVYSSAPTYDGKHYHRVIATPDILKSLISFQLKPLTKPLEFFIHAPTHN